MRFRLLKSYLFWIGIVLPAFVLSKVSLDNHNVDVAVFVISTYVIFTILFLIVDKQVGPRE